ncbi:hypothetical protein CO083_06170 [Candidatus Roizmanbacteria bacterium CG_4_9_14_0_8_um_filter_34_12]|uniref:Glycosyl transferase family 1 domain-containing protein n=2 Tax=Candidatus Roizmaniibacteriota TaxID=1752723 RepID=A0A2M8DB03_9BACT|nr:MAG: hypothetical protein CO083_06170 [Candidatus Roizmanbacteria bacterium CG_4_9_14_0_8_um_filter_34_12]
MKLKIGIDAGDYYPNSPINSGIKRIVNQVLLQLKSQHYKEVIPHIYSFKNRGLLFGSIRLPCYLYKNHDQIFWAFSGQIPWLTKFLPINKVLFLYDLGFYQYPQRFSYPQRLIQQTNQSVKLADKIIVSSQITKDQLIKQFPNINANKISVCYLGIDHLLSINIKSTSPLPYQYFLYVGVVKPLKNLEKLIQIYDQFLKQSPNKKIKLVIIGKAQSNYKNSLLQLINLLKQEQNIIFKDVVTDAELVNYYQHCIALLNVSLVEGFCFPVLEALSLGMSVIVNNLPIYKEYTPFFSNLYISKTKNDFIKKMVVICKNPEIKKQSINIPSQFTWKWYVQKLLENAL